MKTNLNLNRRKAIGSLIVGAAATAPLAFGATELEMWISRWQKSKAFTLAVANAMPADSYSFKPQGIDEVRAFGGQLTHLGQAEGFYLGTFGKNGKAPAAPAGNAPAKDDTVKYLTAQFDWSIGVLKALTPADLTGTFGQGKFATQGLDLILNAFVHTAHTRGYAEMYLRSKGITPPEYAA